MVFFNFIMTEILHLNKSRSQFEKVVKVERSDNQIPVANFTHICYKTNIIKMLSMNTNLKFYKFLFATK